MRDYFRLSLIFLKNRRLRSWLTMLGIFIGITSVVSLISLGQGLQQVVSSQFNLLGTDVLTIQASGVNIGPPGSGVVKPLQKYYTNDIERLVGVETAIGRSIQDAKIQFNGVTDFTFAGSLPKGEKRKEIERLIQLEIDKGAP